MRTPITLVLATIVLFNVGSPAAFCTPPTHAVPKHCKAEQATNALPCCHQDQGTSQDSGSTGTASSCCQVSSSLPSHLFLTPPALSSAEFKCLVQPNWEFGRLWPQAFGPSAGLRIIV